MKQTPYFTYEVGTDEPLHPDKNIATRFVEFGMSDCEFGCKIMADPYSEVRVLVHYEVYGCKKTGEVLKQRRDGEFKKGDFVEFDPYDGDTGFDLTGKVLNYLPPDGKRFKGGYHIACYYVMGSEDLKLEIPVSPSNILPR